MVIDDKEAFLIDIQKPLLDAGYVYLISFSPDYDWTSLLPPANLPPIPGLTQSTMLLGGVTDNPDIVRVARTFMSTLLHEPKKFKPGQPVA